MKQKKLKRFVIDTSVLVSIFISVRIEGFVKYVFTNSLEIYVCPCQLTEIKNTLHKPSVAKYLSFPVDDYIEIMNSILRVVNVDHIYKGCPDPTDDFLYDIAITHTATFVTKEKELLQFDLSPILTINLHEFFELF